MKQDYRWELPGLAIFNLIPMELGDFAMERRMLKGIKSRVERIRAATNAAPAGTKRSQEGALAEIRRPNSGDSP